MIFRNWVGAMQFTVFDIIGGETKKPNYFSNIELQPGFLKFTENHRVYNNYYRMTLIYVYAIFSTAIMVLLKRVHVQNV